MKKAVILIFTVAFFSCESPQKNETTDSDIGVDDTDSKNIVDDSDTDNTANTGDTDCADEIDDIDVDIPVFDEEQDDNTSDEDASDREDSGIFKQWGTDSNDLCNSIAVDSSGNIFVTGWTMGSLDENTNAGSADIFLTKWNTDGTKAWTKQWGTGSWDVGTSVSVDSSGNVFVTGQTYGSLDGNMNSGDLRDVFLTKWNTDGTKAWTKQWGNSLDNYGRSVAVNSSGDIFVTGSTEDSLDGNTSAGDYDIFLTKWNADGTKAWTKQWGTSSEEYGHSVAVSSSGEVFITGWTEGSLDGNASAGHDDVFLTKWNADGTKAWTKQWGTGVEDCGTAVVISSSGDIFVTGYTHGWFDGIDRVGVEDVFLTKWSSEGVEAWTKQWGAYDDKYSDEIGTSIVIDSFGNIFVIGSSDDSTSEYFTDNDVFITKWNADDTKEWTKQWGTSSDDYGAAAVIGSSGNIFVTGWTEGSLDGNTNAGNRDVFLFNIKF